MDSIERREVLQREMSEFLTQLNCLKDPRTAHEKRRRSRATRGLHARLRSLIELDNQTLKH